MARVMLRVFATAMLILLPAVGSDARTWTENGGTHKVEGEFVKLADGKVYIRRDDGQLVRIPLDKLCEDDQTYARKAATPAGDETPFAVVGEEEKPAGKTAAKDAAMDVETVFAEGVGTTKEDAPKDAFRAAVRQVVGEVVDGETLVKNEELVKDQVLTYSDGFIPEHKVTSEKHENTLFRVGIRASVQRRSVIMKLKAANISLKAIDGQSLYGSIVTQITAEKDAAGLVAKVVDGFPDKYIEARVVGEPKTTAKNDSEATLVVNVEFTPSLVAYKTFASKLCQTLDGTCKMKGEFTSVIPKVSDNRGRGQYFYVGGGDFQATAAKWMPELWKVEKSHWRWQSKRFAIAVATLVSADSSRMRNLKQPIARGQQRKPAVVSNESSRISWNYYVLDEAIGHRLLRATSRQATCKLTFLDASDRVISIDEFVPRNHHFPRGRPDDWEGANSWRCFLRVFYDFKPHQRDLEPGRFVSDDKSEANFAFVAPLFFGLGSHEVTSFLCYVPRFTEAREVHLSLGELQKVAKVKCELTFRAVN